MHRCVSSKILKCFGKAFPFSPHSLISLFLNSPYFNIYINFPQSPIFHYLLCLLKIAMSYRVSQKNAPQFCLIALATNMLEGIFHLKGGIHSSILSTKTFLYSDREPRYTGIKSGYQISKICINDQSYIFESNSVVIYA